MIPCIRIWTQRGQALTLAAWLSLGAAYCPSDHATPAPPESPVVGVRRTLGLDDAGAPQPWDPPSDEDLAAIASWPKRSYPPDPGRIRMLIFTRCGVVTLDLELQIDGKSCAEFRRPLIDALLRDADPNQDGRATWAEAIANLDFGQQRLRSFLSGPNALDPARRRSQAVACDLDSDGIVDRHEAELLWMHDVAPLSVGYGDEHAGPAGRHVLDVFHWLDTDADGALSADEITQAGARLAAHDTNGNEYLEMTECDEREPVVLACADCVAGMFFESLACFTPGKDAWKLEWLAPKPQLAWPAWWREHAASLPARLGESKDWRIERAAIAAMQAHLTFRLNFPPGDAHPRFELQQAAPWLASRVQQTDRGDTVLALAGLTLWMHAEGLPMLDTATTARRFLASYDEDANGYLEAHELEGKKTHEFRSLDRDHDGQATVEEIRAYFDWSETPGSTQFQLRAGDSRLPWFSLLDVDGDRMLSLREMCQSPARLRSFDRDQDGRLTSGELPTTCSLVIQRGGIRAHPHARVAVPDGAPSKDWFGRMDRNGDGDLSPREFLGSAQKFRLLDRDEDGLLDRAETSAPEPRP